MSTSAKSVKYVNPVLVDEVGRGLVDAARRLLEYERFHDRLEMMKMEEGSLPQVVEQRVGRSIEATSLDARALGRFLIEAVEECEDVDALGSMISSLEARSVASLLEEGSPYLEDWLERRGMPRELWQWGLQYTDWGGLAFRVEGETIIINAGHHKIRVLTSKHGNVLDPASFVTRAFGLQPRYRPSAGSETAASATPLSIVRTAVRTVVSFYHSRAVRTAIDGVQVLSTGVPWLIILLIIAAVILIVGLTLTILCNTGVITDRGTCAVAPFFILVGFLGLGGGGITGNVGLATDADDTGGVGTGTNPLSTDAETDSDPSG